MNSYPRFESLDCRFSMEIRLDRRGGQVNNRRHSASRRLPLAMPMR